VRKRVKGVFGKTRGSCPDSCLGAPYNIFDPSRDEVRIPEKACIVVSVKQIDVLISKSLGHCLLVGQFFASGKRASSYSETDLSGTILILVLSPSYIEPSFIYVSHISR
jgi:hypothetical protein